MYCHWTTQKILNLCGLYTCCLKSSCLFKICCFRVRAPRCVGASHFRTGRRCGFGLGCCTGRGTRHSCVSVACHTCSLLQGFYGFRGNVSFLLYNSSQVQNIDFKDLKSPCSGTKWKRSMVFVLVSLRTLSAWSFDESVKHQGAGRASTQGAHAPGEYPAFGWQVAGDSYEKLIEVVRGWGPLGGWSNWNYWGVEAVNRPCCRTFDGLDITWFVFISSSSSMS